MPASSKVTGPLLVGLFLGVFSSGCGGKPTADVSGQVTFAGKPVQLGAIAFYAHNGDVVTAIVRAGEYHAVKVPVGKVRLTVQSHAPPPAMARPDGPQSAALPSGNQAGEPYVPVPERYRDAATSGLTLDVRAGQMEHNVDLTP